MRTPRLGRRFRLLTAAVLMLLALCLWPVARGRTAAERAAAWVAQAHDSLPSRLDEINLYPVEYREAIFLAHKPAVRFQLWQE